MNLRVTFMMHSLLAEEGWPYSFLAMRPEELDLLIGRLRRWRFRFVPACRAHEATGRVACLTFDDGFLDNWTLLHPLLEREGIPYTIFICRDFVEAEGEPRPAGLRRPGYLNQAELRALASGGLADIQSHSTTHTWWPIAPEVVDLLDAARPERHPWVVWNQQPALKPGWLQADATPWQGWPVLRNDRALRARRWLLDEERWERLARRVAAERLGVAEANRLLREDSRLAGRAETLAEREARCLSEFRDTAFFLEELLGRRPTVLCWPGGAYDDQALELARREGYISTANRGWGRDPHHLHRISPVNPYGRERFPWRHQRQTLDFYLARFAWHAWRRGGPN